MDFPAWIPNWVVEEYRRDLSSEPGIDEDWGGDPEECRRLLDLVIESSKALVVWDSLGRYSERKDRLIELASFVWSAHWSFGHVAIKKSDKMRIAKDARKHARALAECLSMLTVQDGFLMNTIVSSFADESMSQQMTGRLREFHEIYNDRDSHDFVPADTLRRAAPAIKRVASNVVSDALFGDFEHYILGGLCGSLDKWANRDPVVTKPEHENAKRLFFIRNLTHSFMGSYGRPMRKETLALASVFFECEGLDEASISRLAPVRKCENSDE